MTQSNVFAPIIKVCYMLRNVLPRFRSNRLFYCFLLFGMMLSGTNACQTDRPAGAQNEAQAAAADSQSYTDQVNEWHEQRIASLQGERGWLKLAGLYWLDDGRHSFGSAAENDIVMPKGAISRFAGDIVREGNMITVEPAEDGMLDVNEEALTGSITFPVENELEFTHGRLAWRFIGRGDLIGLRLYDQESEVFRNFKGFERFAVSDKYLVEAELVPHNPPRSLPVINILGQTTMQETPGTLVFELDGITHELIPQSASDGERLFIVMADQTSGEETFGGGRFLYADAPGSDGKVILDFNKAYNPPCSFSEYTTCPLPPPENRLSIAIEAGEKRYN